jgi:DNA-binding response OmpR family regulator
MEGGRTRILIVEDDESTAEAIAFHMRAAGLEPTVAADGLAGLRALRSSSPDAVVLDLMLPGMSGLDVCRDVQRGANPMPVVLLTALGEEHDRVLGLDLGADDYVTKPFSPRELVLRVGSVLRRARPGAAVLIDGALRVDQAARRAEMHGCELALTTREFDLLAFLLAHPGRAFSRGELLTEVWGWSFGDESTVTVHVRRLREKIEADPTRPRRIATIWGTGYRYDPDP